MALSAFALAALLLSSTPALACSCITQTVEQAKEGAVAIFEGRVTSIADAPKSGDQMFSEKSVELAIVRSWRGLEDQEAVTLRTAEDGATCGYLFELGASYLIYASGEPGKLSVNSCSRTRPIGEAGEDLAALGAGVTPVKVAPAKDAANAPPKTKSGGCASGKASASASTASLWWFGTPGLSLFVRRRRTRA